MSTHDVAGEDFSDEDEAFLRHVRFGELPARVRADDQVAATETEPRRDLPDPEPPTIYQVQG